MPGPYNIDNEINAGDPGQLAWAESVADAVNDLDSRVTGVETGGGSGMEGVWADPITSGKVRIGGMILLPNNWKFVDAGRVYYYPVYYAEPFGVSDLGVSLRSSAAGGTAYFGLQDATGPGGGPGDVVAQASVPTDTSGWKNVSITPVTALPAGWYWHAFMATGSLDVFGGQPLAVIDAATMEYAVRDGEWRWRGKASSSAGLTSLPNDPATIGAEAAIIPMVGVRFA